MPRKLLAIISGVLLLGMSTASLIQPPEIASVIEETIPQKNYYRVVIVGDSMSSGIDIKYLTSQLTTIKPGITFEVENLSKADQSIDQVSSILKDKTFDILVIESMAYTPIQATSESEIRSRQTSILNQLMTDIRHKYPQSKVLFLATIAPSKEKYAQGKFKIPQDVSEMRAIERQQSLESFILYAKEHDILLINSYQQSLQSDGSANLDFIDPQDFIHPSNVGLKLIQDQIVEYLTNSM